MSDKMMDRIQALLNQANHPNTGDAERQAFMEMADQLQHKHKIDAIMLKMRAAGKEQPKLSEPIKEVIDWVERWDDFFDIHVGVVAALSNLTGVRMVMEGSSKLALFGYPDDIAYFRTLWLSSYLTFSSRLFPKWDSTMTDGENIKALAEAGEPWKKIWTMGRVAGHLEGVAEPPADNGKMKRMYAKACRDMGVEKMKLTQRNRAYRDSYAVGFRAVLVERCYGLRADRDARERAASSGVGLMLSREANAIEELIKRTYPDGLGGSVSANRVRAHEAAGAALGAAAGRSVDLTGGGSTVGAGTPRGAVGA